MKMVCRKIFKYKILIYDISSFSSVMLPALEQVVHCTDHMQSYHCTLFLQEQVF